MCLEKKGMISLRYAWKPKKVYKILEKYRVNDNIKYITPYIAEEVEIGKEMIPKTSLIKGLCSSYLTNEVIHCYEDWSTAMLHIPWSLYDLSYVIVKCTIPAGTFYWVGKCGDIGTRKVILEREHIRIM